MFNTLKLSEFIYLEHIITNDITVIYSKYIHKFNTSSASHMAIQV